MKQCRLERLHNALQLVNIDKRIELLRDINLYGRKLRGSYSIRVIYFNDYIGRVIHNCHNGVYNEIKNKRYHE